jgi:hypothetical protein
MLLVFPDLIHLSFMRTVISPEFKDDTFFTTTDSRMESTSTRSKKWEPSLDLCVPAAAFCLTGLSEYALMFTR